jgi:Asp-tRNA(Asn)/Glu-tRNA(Gln) amidotransferase A subunit family amidase
MTRSVDDCILLDGILAGAPLDIPSIGLEGLRLGLPQTMVLDDLDAHVAASLSAALTRLSTAGARIVETPLTLYKDFNPLRKFSATESYAWHRKLLAEREAEYDPRVASRIKAGADFDAADYIDLCAARRRWIAGMERELAHFDALVMPTVAIVAPPINELTASDEAYVHANALVLRNASSVNMMDGCAISIPCQAEGTLPVGLMLVGSGMSDARLLAIARAVEAALRA